METSKYTSWVTVESPGMPAPGEFRLFFLASTAAVATSSKAASTRQALAALIAPMVFQPGPPQTQQAKGHQVAQALGR